MRRQEGPIGTERKQKSRKDGDDVSAEASIRTKLWARAISLLTRTIVQSEDSRGLKGDAGSFIAYIQDVLRVQRHRKKKELNG